MNRRDVIQLFLPVALGCCLMGCARHSKPPYAATENSNAVTAPNTVTAQVNTRPNPVGPVPIVGRTVTLNDLKELGLFYMNAASLGTAPTKLDDLDMKREAPKLYQAVEDKHIILYWKADVNNAPAGASNTVLGYAADVPTKGGPVLMLDGSARTMTAAEFSKAPKAGS